MMVGRWLGWGAWPEVLLEAIEGFIGECVEGLKHDLERPWVCLYNQALGMNWIITASSGLMIAAVRRFAVNGLWGNKALT